MIRRLLVTGVIALAPLAAVSPASAAADPAAVCKSGGFASYVDPTTGQPFKNQGLCVAFVNGGGTLVPVSPPVPVYNPTVNYIDPVAEVGPGSYRIGFTVSGFEPGTYVKLSQTNILGGLNTQTFAIDANGNSAAGMMEMFGSCSDASMLPTFVTAEGPIRADGTRLTASIVPAKPAQCVEAEGPMITIFDYSWIDGRDSVSVTLSGFDANEMVTIQHTTAQPIPGLGDGPYVLYNQVTLGEEGWVNASVYFADGYENCAVYPVVFQVVQGDGSVITDNNSYTPPRCA